MPLIRAFREFPADIAQAVLKFIEIVFIAANPAFAALKVKIYTEN
jgi:hypothetical protein